MKQKVISGLPEIFKNNLSSLKKTSFDDAHREYMTEADIQVVKFDNLSDIYAKGKGWNGVPKTNDALYIDEDNKWTFIEFKNGSIKKDDIYRKLYDSLIILYELKLISDFNFSRNNISYILVYNDSFDDKISKSINRDKIYSHVTANAKRPAVLFDLDCFEGYLLKSAGTYKKSDFNDNFVSKLS